MTKPPPRTPDALWVLGLLFLLAACGVPVQDQPTVIDPTNVPNRLLHPGDSKPDATPTQRRQVNPVTYFVDSGKLVGVKRDLSDGTLRARLTGAILALVSGPTETEQATGLSTALPAGLSLDVATVNQGRATIALTGEPSNSPPEDNVRAVAQIVLTATAQPEIDEVVLTRDGQAIGAPLIDGSLKDAALTAADYASLVAR